MSLGYGWVTPESEIVELAWAEPNQHLDDVAYTSNYREIYSVIGAGHRHFAL